MARKRWEDLTPVQQSAVVVAGAVELALTTVALVDLARRPADRVRGSKALWTVGVFVQPIGPLAYLLWGRRPANG